MVKQKITLSIDEGILKKYREKAEEGCISISKKVERFFRKELNKQNR